MTLQDDEAKVVAVDNKLVAWVKANPSKVVLIAAVLVLVLFLKLV